MKSICGWIMRGVEEVWKFCGGAQEAAESITFGRHLSNRLRFIYSESWRRELSIGINMSRIREGGGVSPDVILVLGGGDQFFPGPLPRNFNISSESSAQAQSIATLFEQIG